MADGFPSGNTVVTAVTPVPCGSELARDGCYDDARLLKKRGAADTIASRLAPTGNCDRQQKTPQLSQRGFGCFNSALSDARASRGIWFSIKTQRYKFTHQL